MAEIITKSQKQFVRAIKIMSRQKSNAGGDHLKFTKRVCRSHKNSELFSENAKRIHWTPFGHKYDLLVIETLRKTNLPVFGMKIFFLKRQTQNTNQSILIAKKTTMRPKSALMLLCGFKNNAAVRIIFSDIFLAIANFNISKVNYAFI